MRRVSGLDVNGWHDFAARDWDPDDFDQLLSTPVTLDGGSGSVAIRQESGDWIGGPQAALAPHGRGNGWGNLGATDRRLPIAEVYDAIVLGMKTTTDAFVATVDALSRNANVVMLAVPDTPDVDEAAQDRFLKPFRRRRRSHRLLWRPVALFLHAFESGVIGKDDVDKCFCFLIHSGDGIEVQTLRMRADEDHPGHFAPERDGYGTRILQHLGLTSIEKIAHSAVLASNPILTEWGCEETKLGLQILCGDVAPGTTHVLRHNNANWLEILAPPISIGSALEIESQQDVFESIFNDGPIDQFFFTTPLANQFAESIALALGNRFPNIVRLNWSAVARGALQAGRLIERGLPHYFDRLTPIKLVVQKNGEPCFEDLVETNVTLPANREYISPPYRDLMWGGGKGEIDFYVLKGDTEVRHWQAKLENPPEQDVAVELRLRQTPGQSWAKLSLSSSDWEPLQRNPIFLDWAALEPVSKTPKEILDQLRTPPPTIPIRIIESPHIDFWRGNDRLASILEEFNQSHAPRPDVIAKLLSRSMRDPNTKIRYWPIGTDGVFPEDLSRNDLQKFKELMATFAFDVMGAIDDNEKLYDNHKIRCLTWIFTLCPNNIQQAIVDGLEADLAGRDHVLLRPSAARRVLTQGAGRVVSDASHLRRVLTVLVARKTNNDTLNALSMVLSRRAKAPEALSGALVREIAALALTDLVQLTAARSFKTRFKNAMSALAGLFRYREIEPFALLAGRDPIATQVQEKLDEIERLLDRNRGAISQRQEKMAMIASLKELVQGGGDPNILTQIEGLDEDGAEEDSA